MLALILISVALVALAVLGLSVGILHGRGFPQYDVGSNEEMRKRGIRCFKDVDAELHGRPKGCNGTPSEACKDCALYAR